MSNKLDIKIITPNLVILQETAEFITLQGDDGEIGILPEHISLVSRLSPGLIKVYEGSKVLHKIFASHGVVKVDNNKVSIMTDATYKISELDPHKASKELKDLESDVMNAVDSSYVSSLLKQIELRRKIIEISADN